MLNFLLVLGFSCSCGPLWCGVGTPLPNRVSKAPVQNYSFAISPQKNMSATRKRFCKNSEITRWNHVKDVGWYGWQYHLQRIVWLVWKFIRYSQHIRICAAARENFIRNNRGFIPTFYEGMPLWKGILRPSATGYWLLAVDAVLLYYLFCGCWNLPNRSD